MRKAYTSEELENQTIAEIAALPRPPRDHLLALADSYQPPQTWHEGEDC